jgi:hypothetical protein
LAGRQQAQHVVLGGEARGEGETVGGSLATQLSSAFRVGFDEREYSKPSWSPTARCANVVESVIGVTTAPVATSGA